LPSFKYIKYFLFSSLVFFGLVVDFKWNIIHPCIYPCRSSVHFDVMRIYLFQKMCSRLEYSTKVLNIYIYSVVLAFIPSPVLHLNRGGYGGPNSPFEGELIVKPSLRTPTWPTLATMGGGNVGPTILAENMVMNSIHQWFQQHQNSYRVKLLVSSLCRYIVWVMIYYRYNTHKQTVLKLRNLIAVRNKRYKLYIFA